MGAGAWHHTLRATRWTKLILMRVYRLDGPSWIVIGRRCTDGDGGCANVRVVNIERSVLF